MARRSGLNVTSHRNGKRLGVAWLLFIANLFCLWFAFNALFMVPGEHLGQRDATAVWLALAGIGVALPLAWMSGKNFQAAYRTSDNPYRSTLSTPPMIFCVAILLIFVGLLSC
jgi:hypothetical protein